MAALTDASTPRVLEIGPGKGALTQPLLERFDRLLALELDESLVPALREQFGTAGVEFRAADALKEPLDPLLDEEAPWQVAANLPYSVGTAILRRLLPRNDLFTRIVVMLQQEVVDRLVARPAGKGHGIMALERAAFAEAYIAFQVPPNAFKPRPRVMSAVVVFDLHPAPHSPESLSGAFSLACRALTMPRKVLTNALAPDVGSDQLEAADIDPKLRPGTLDLADWVRLAGVIGRQ